MEDRHSVSNPRPFPGGGSDGVKVIPTWEVDIIRDGSVIVDTFVLNKEEELYSMFWENKAFVYLTSQEKHV